MRVCVCVWVRAVCLQCTWGKLTAIETGLFVCLCWCFVALKEAECMFIFPTSTQGPHMYTCEVISYLLLMQRLTQECDVVQRIL